MEEKHENKQGGARKGAGRKKIPAGEKKVALTFYVKKKDVPKARRLIEDLLKNEGF